MGQPANPSHPPIARWKWKLVWLMFLATMINYMDRQTLGSVSGYFIREFDLNADGHGEERYGWVEFAFGITFATTQLLAGTLADRCSIRWLYAAALLIWSAAGFACGLVHSLWLFIVCRMVLGFGESFNWPCAVAVVQRTFPVNARSFANGVFHGGGSIGAIVTPLLVLAIVGPNGEHWRSVFLITGGVGAIWVISWLSFVHGERAVEIDRRPVANAIDGEPETVWDMLCGRRIWIAMLVGLAINVTWHFFRIWLPRIFEKDLHFDSRTMQWLLAGFYICADIGGMTAGFVTRRLTHSGMTIVGARKVVMFGTAGLVMLAGPGALALNPYVTVPLFFVVAAGALGGFPNYFNLAQDTSPRHTAQALGLTGFVSWGTVAVVNPYVGRIADRLGTFTPVIIVVSFVPLIGALIGLAWPRDKQRAV